MTEDEERDPLDNTPMRAGDPLTLKSVLETSTLAQAIHQEFYYEKLLNSAEVLINGRSLMTALLNEDTCLSIQCHQGHRLRRLLHSVGSWIILEYRVPLRLETPADTILVTVDFAEALECLQQ